MHDFPVSALASSEINLFHGFPLEIAKNEDISKLGYIQDLKILQQCSQKLSFQPTFFL